MFLDRFANNPLKNPKIGVGERFAYGLGDFASQMLYTPTGALLIYYYTEFIGVNIAVVASIMLFSRFFDGFSDLFMGYLIEKTNSRFGKARVWIIRMLIPFFIAMVALFAVPTGWSDTWKYIYIFISYNFAITVVYTAINMPYGVVANLLTSNSYQRSIIVIYRMLLATAGNTLTLAVTLPMVEFFGNTAQSWTITFIILAIIATVCFLITFTFCHERVAPTPSEEMHGNTMKAVKLMFRNKYWIMVTLAMLTIFSADIVWGTANTYYSRYFLNDPKLVGTFSVIMNVFKIGSMIIILPILLRTVGKRKAMVVAILCILASLLLRIVNPDNATFAFVLAALYGFGQGFTYACLFAMIPDTVDYGEYTDKERHDGLIYSGASFGTKLAAGLGAFAASMTMDLGGYINNAETQTPGAMNAILMATTVVPAALYVCGLLCMVGYKLDNIFPEVVKELARRKSEKAQAESAVNTKVAQSSN